MQFYVNSNQGSKFAIKNPDFDSVGNLIYASRYNKLTIACNNKGENKVVYCGDSSTTNNQYSIVQLDYSTGAVLNLKSLDYEYSISDLACVYDKANRKYRLFSLEQHYSNYSYKLCERDPNTLDVIRTENNITINAWHPSISASWNGSIISLVIVSCTSNGCVWINRIDPNTFSSIENTYKDWYLLVSSKSYSACWDWYNDNEVAYVISGEKERMLNIYYCRYVHWSYRKYNVF